MPCSDIARDRPFSEWKPRNTPRHVAGLAFGRAQANQQRLEHGEMLVALRAELLPKRLDEVGHGTGLR